MAIKNLSATLSDGPVRKIPDEEFPAFVKMLNPSTDTNVFAETKNTPALHVKSGDVKFDSIKPSKVDDIMNFIGVDENGVLKRIEIPSSVNKNAYEIRLDVIKEAIDLAKYQSESNKKIASVDDVLDIASKLYKFIEFRR
jgi:hypothetical protein